MIRKPRRRLLYPMGLISLSVLPFLFWNYFYQDYLKVDKQRILNVVYWSPRDTLIGPDPREFVNETFMKITFDGSPDDKIKLEFARIAVRELIHQNDTTRGIEFTLRDDAKYSSLVALFNICEMEGAMSYLNFEDKFWVFNLWPLNRRTQNISM